MGNKGTVDVHEAKFQEKVKQLLDAEDPEKHINEAKQIFKGYEHSVSSKGKSTGLLSYDEVKFFSDALINHYKIEVNSLFSKTYCFELNFSVLIKDDLVL